MCRLHAHALTHATATVRAVNQKRVTGFDRLFTCERHLRCRCFPQKFVICLSARVCVCVCMRTYCHLCAPRLTARAHKHTRTHTHTQRCQIKGSREKEVLCDENVELKLKRELMKRSGNKTVQKREESTNVGGGGGGARASLTRILSR